MSSQPWRRFWFVWGGKDARVPTVRHDSLAVAMAEAKRLAAGAPGAPFIVLSAKCLVRAQVPGAEPRVRWFPRGDAAAQTAAAQAADPGDDALVDAPPTLGAPSTAAPSSQDVR